MTPTLPQNRSRPKRRSPMLQIVVIAVLALGVVGLLIVRQKQQTD